jgi:hypothetical protein
MESSDCQRSQCRRFSSGGSISGTGSVARIAVSSAWSQRWSTALDALRTPLTRTSPLAGWNRVNYFAVPSRTCSCG